MDGVFFIAMKYVHGDSLRHVNARLKQRGKTLPKAIDPIVLRALDRDRTRRWPSAGALQSAIEELIVRQQLPASAAHVAAFLKALYTPDAPEEASTQVEHEPGDT